MTSIPAERREILDWFHLKENLYTIQGSLHLLERVESHLWKGHVDAIIAEFEGCTAMHVQNFKAYLQTHRHRILNSNYLTAEGISIGSDKVEASIKQMGRRIKISGAQWKRENVTQVLRYRAAYLKRLLA
jgi:riboflavin synthase alpha subunit